MSGSHFTETGKSKSEPKISDRLKYKYRSRNFWCNGYFADTIGKMQRSSRHIYETRRSEKRPNFAQKVYGPVYRQQKKAAHSGYLW